MSNIPLKTPVPTVTKFSFILIVFKFLRSKIIPSLSALPTNPVPPPLTVTEIFSFCANLIRIITSSSFLGITTILGII